MLGWLRTSTGKEPYSDGSCRPVGSKKKKKDKKKEKSASDCGSHPAKPVAAVKKKVKKKQEKSAGKRGLWDNVHAKENVEKNLLSPETKTILIQKVGTRQLNLPV